MEEIYKHLKSMVYTMRFANRTKTKSKSTLFGEIGNMTMPLPIISCVKSDGLEPNKL